MATETGAGGPRIVILGGGFAGAWCARRLARELPTADILVIDVHNYFVFHPLLVEAGVGHLEPRHVVVPLRSFFNRRVRFRMAEVEGVDAEARQVRYRVKGEADARVTPYDHLVLAMGSVTFFPDTPGLRENAFQVKSLGDAVSLRDRVVQLMERANLVEDAEERRRLLRLVVVGGSFTGVETAGEFQDFLHKGTSFFRNLTPSDAEVVLIERGPRILPALQPSLASYAHQRLGARGVRIVTEKTLRSVEPGSITLDSGEVIAAETLVWCAGIAQNPRARTLPFSQDQRGFLLAAADGRLTGQANVWGIGDGTVNPRPGGGTYPPTAQAAVRLGEAVARNIAAAVKGKPTQPIDFPDLGSLCVLGGQDAVAQFFGIRLAGFLAWWMWRTVYLMKMPGIGRKARVALDWTIALFFRIDVVQLGLHARPRQENEERP
ncbi:hypothetical protein GC173_17500 [bacterium]|nr:hypothetical protein [bacterium]